MNPNIKRFNKLLINIGLRLDKLEKSDIVRGIDAAKLRYNEKERLYRLLEDLKRFAIEAGLLPRMQGIIHALEKRIERLPRGPHFPTVREAQSLLEYPNLGILAAEERPRSEHEPPEVARLVVTNSTGIILFDHILPSLQTPSLLFACQQNMGLSASDEEAVSVMTRLWPDLLSVVKGRFILSEDNLLTQIQLMVTAERFDLEPPVVIGCSALDLCHQYLETPSLAYIQAEESSLLTDLASLCEQLGVLLPGFPRPTVLDRAIGMLHIMQAMAQGVAPVYWPQDDKEADYEGIDH